MWEGSHIYLSRSNIRPSLLFSMWTSLSSREHRVRLMIGHVVSFYKASLLNTYIEKLIHQENQWSRRHLLNNSHAESSRKEITTTPYARLITFHDSFFILFSSSLQSLQVFSFNTCIRHPVHIISPILIRFLPSSTYQTRVGWGPNTGAASNYCMRRCPRVTLRGKCTSLIQGPWVSSQKTHTKLLRVFLTIEWHICSRYSRAAL